MLTRLVTKQDSMLLLNEDIQRHEKLALIFDPELGRGIAARKIIEVGELITTLHSTGSLTLAEIRAATDAIDNGALDPKALKILYDVIQVEEDRFMLPTPSVGFLLNHSCDPNAALVAAQDRFEFRAIRKIAIGEEVRWNYATTMGDWFTMQCKCGSSACYGIVAGPLSLSCIAREEMLKQFGEEMLLPHIARWLRTGDCPSHLTGERYLRDFEGEAAMKKRILLKHPRLHHEVHKRVRAALANLRGSNE